MLGHVMSLLSRPYHSMTLQELSLYRPNDAERASPALYADNVCQTVANALNIPVSHKTMYDNPELRSVCHCSRQRGGVGIPSCFGMVAHSDCFLAYLFPAVVESSSGVPRRIKSCLTVASSIHTPPLLRRRIRTLLTLLAVPLESLCR